MSQQDDLELAKQGNPQAIANLINPYLQTKDITARVALKNSCLQVMLESTQVPEQQVLVPFIRKGITSLGTKLIERVKVYGRQTGDEFPAWNTEFEIVVPTNPTSSPVELPSTTANSASVGFTNQTKKQKLSFIQVFFIVFILLIVGSVPATIGLGVFVDGYFFSMGWIKDAFNLCFLGALVGAVISIFIPIS